MKPKHLINLFVLASFYLSYPCFFPKKASAEIVQTTLGNIRIVCDTNSQRCYTPQNGRWAYVGTIREISNHQSEARMCRDASLGERYAAYFTRYTDCSIYGYPRNQTAEDASSYMKKQIEKIEQDVLDMLK